MTQLFKDSLCTGVQLSEAKSIEIHRNPSKTKLLSDQRSRVRPREAGNIAKRPPAMFPTVLDRLRVPTGPVPLIFVHFAPKCGFRSAEGLQPMTPL